MGMFRLGKKMKMVSQKKIYSLFEKFLYLDVIGLPYTDFTKITLKNHFYKVLHGYGLC